MPNNAELVLLDLVDGVATVTLNDPDRRNVFTMEMSAQVESFLDDLEANPEARAIVFTGAGKGFSSGGHLDELVANNDHDGLRRIYAGFLRVAHSPLPTIAAVNGAAVGAGMNFELACDVIVAGESAKFDSRFLQIGIGPGGGHTWRLRNITDLQTAKAMVLFGEVLRGPRAAEVGLAWKCVPDEELLASAQAMAAVAAAAPRELVVRTKQTLIGTQLVDTSEASVDQEIDTQVWSMQQPAFVEMVEGLKKRMKG